MKYIWEKGPRADESYSGDKKPFNMKKNAFRYLVYFLAWADACYLNRLLQLYLFHLMTLEESWL